MRKSLQFYIMSFILLTIIMGTMHYLFLFTPTYNIQTLDRGWTVVFRNEQYINTNLEQMSKQISSTFSKGDTFTLNYEKPLEDLGVPFPYLLFKTQFCGYEVYLDGKLIAEENSDAVATRRFVGVAYNSVELPKDLEGRVLSIKIIVCENNTRSNIVSPLLGDFDDIYRYLYHSAVIPTFTGVFLIVFGVVFLLISLFFYLKSSRVSNQVITSMLSISLGIWILTAYNSADTILTSSFSTSIEFIALYTFIPLMYMLVRSLHPRFNNMVITFLAYSSAGFGILFVTLHAFDIVHLNQFLMPYYLMSIVAAAMLILYDYMDIRTKTKNSSTSTMMVGLSVLSVCLLIYEGFAFSNSFVDYRQTPILDFIVPFGCLFFVMTELLNHFIFMTRSFAQRNEYLSLTKIAYIDNLTGIPNRASCDDKLQEIDKSNDDFCILSLDLNGLKEVNDNSGHPAGDRLLKSFAACLMDIFSGKGSCFRVGGDEFIVLFSHAEKEELDKLLAELDEKLSKLDLEDPEVNHSVSYGYAFRSETEEKDTHSVNMLADKRMYEYKKKYYSHMMQR